MKTAISVPDEVFREVNKVAKERNSSRSEVIVTAVKEYLERRKSSDLLSALNQAYGTAETAEEYEVRKKAKKRYSKAQRAKGAIVTIRQGDVYWINLDEPRGSEPGYRHPHVVVQNNLFNASKIGP